MTEDEQLNILLEGGITVASGSTGAPNAWDGVAKGRSLKSRPRGFSINKWVASGFISLMHQTRMQGLFDSLQKGDKAYFPFVVFPKHDVDGTIKTVPTIVPVAIGTPSLLVCRSCGGIHGTQGGFDARSFLAKPTDETLLDVPYGSPMHYFIQVGFTGKPPVFPVTVLNSHELPTLKDGLSGLTWVGFIQSQSCAGMGAESKAHYLSLPNRITVKHQVPYVEPEQPQKAKKAKK